MECNKDEAIRAKAIAEEKMQAGDFTTARRIVLKAQQLYPDLENLSQMLTVCEVHCCAQIKVNGAEMDWYGILQVEKFSDEAIVKKQFRKLALSLHPDKNKFAGAEAAFKLISQASKVLSDPTQRPLYDIKCRASVRPVIAKPAASNQWNANLNSMAQQHVANKFSNASSVPYTGFASFEQRRTFWTSCPSCKMKFEYFRDFVGRTLRCQNCQKNFVAHDLGPDFVPCSVKFPPSMFARQNENVNQGPPKVSVQKDGGNTFGAIFQNQFTKNNQIPKSRKSFNVDVGKPEGSKVGSFSEVGGSSKPQEKSDGHGEVKEGQRDVPMQNLDATKSKKSQSTAGANRKRGRKSSVDTSNCEGSDDNPGLRESGFNTSAHASGPNEGPQTRTSSRQKRQVSCNKYASHDNGIACPATKKSKGNGSSTTSSEETKEFGVDNGVSIDESFAAVHKNKEDFGAKATFGLNESISDEKAHCGVTAGLQASLERADVEFGSDRGRMEVESGSYLNGISGLNMEFLEPEFTNFDEFREDHCFAVNQVWAIYDPVDGMPRYYARVEKVFSTGFKLRITWFETDTDDKKEQAWCKGKLPVSCGKYEIGGTENTKDRLMFSHQIHWTRVTRGSFFFYPQKGQTWAIFKNWSIEWGSDPGKHRPPYQFKIVEILSDFDKNMGIGISYLEKVEGFVSIFIQATDGGFVSSYITPPEIYKFSHQIPSIKMTGNEGSGVPEGALELDTASLPADLLEAGDGLKDGCGKCVSSGNVGQSKGIGPSSQVDRGIETPQKQVSGELGLEGLKLRTSPSDLRQRNSQAGGRKLVSEMASGSNVAANNDGNHCQESASTSRSDNRHLHVADGSTKGLPTSPSSWRDTVIEVVPHDFSIEKSEDKFQVGQVWALFNSKDGMPKDFVVIKKVQTAPSFRVHVANLKACQPPKDITRPVCCGVFQVNNLEIRVLSLTSFSHQLTVDCFGKNKYKIFPRKGEIWAIYKHWNPKSTSSDENSNECDFVVVLASSDLGAKVAILTQMNGYDRFFCAPRTQRLRGGVVDISHSQFARFSHRCCAIQHTGKNDSPLKGCWEVDSSSMPGQVIVLD